MRDTAKILLNAYHACDYVESEDPRKVFKLRSIHCVYNAWLRATGHEVTNRSLVPEN